MSTTDSSPAQVPSRLKAAFESGKFVVTCELSPPKGADLSALFAKAERLRDAADAFNLTDSAAARMTMDPAAAGHHLLKRGIEPIVQITSRDKNRIAIQSGMLGAAALGISNLVVMGGDPPRIGDHPEAKGVNDLFSSEIIAAASALNNGADHAGNPLKGGTDFLVGSVCNPGAGDLDAEVENTRRKRDAGARFFQTQAIYRIDQLQAFLERLNDPGITILAGIIPVKSVKMATYMNQRVPGIDIPEAVIERIFAAERAGRVVEESLEIAASTIGGLQALCGGVHIMAVGWEKHIPALLARAGLAVNRN
ncbi:MAG: methylenetetrahydrofolate reductase [Gammaproteobacteria bacterium]|nr:methylenetetrahydrofolate reductase [Gammaproteobacteria bacterium]